MASVVKRLMSVDYEVFGRVQGVFFRKHTKKTALKLTVVGWVQNSPNKTVVGQIQGKEDDIKEMKRWLSNDGSPASRIDRCEFKNEIVISNLDYTDFKIKR